MSALLKAIIHLSKTSFGVIHLKLAILGLNANELAFTLLGYFMIRQPGSSGIKKRNFDETGMRACALGA
jgi:hypothetical protein